MTVYTINPTAESSDMVEADTPEDLDAALDSNGADPFGGTINFAQLAPSTGGIAFTGRNDLNNVIGEGIAAGQDYYTLSYSPTNGSKNAAAFRHIKVVMTDPNLRAFTRDGYFPETAADTNPVADPGMKARQVRANLQLDLSSALTTQIAYNGLAVTAAKAANGEYAIHVTGNGIGWSGPAAEGAAANGQEHEEATVAAAWYDSKGRILGHVAREEVSLRGAGDAGATFQLPVTLPANATRLRFVVRDALNGSMGTVDLKY